MDPKKLIALTALCSLVVLVSRVRISMNTDTIENDLWAYQVGWDDSRKFFLTHHSKNHEVCQVCPH